MSKFAQAVAAITRPPDQDPQTENQLLRRQLKAFLTEARQNEEKLRRFQALELRLIGCNSLIELLQRVLYEYRATARLDRVSLLLYDPEYELRRILEDDGIRLENHPDLVFTEHQGAIDTFFGLSPSGYVGPYRADRHARMFAPARRLPASVALLPMMLGGEVVGTLNLGSNRAERFLDGTASDFLSRLASIVAVCLRNTVNNERLKRVGLTDVLTGVNNRRYFDQRLAEETALAQRNVTPISCLFMDVDRFKQVNDNFGHQAGDAVLREVAGLIRMNLRASDVLARYGGEEFAALLLNTGRNGALEIAERIRRCIAERHFQLEDGRVINVTISIGVASVLPRGQMKDADALGTELVECADRCVFRAKHGGRNRVVVADAEPEVLN